MSEWKKHSFFNPGQKVALSMTVIDTATEEELIKIPLAANCYVMLVGREQSPRECIRPKVDAWVQQTFQTTESVPMHTDMSTFDMMRRGR